jgi:hypothetical protein
MEVDIVHGDGVFMVLHENLDRVADAHPHEGSGNLVVEGPVVVGRAVRQFADDFDRLQIDADSLGTAVADSEPAGRSPNG